MKLSTELELFDTLVLVEILFIRVRSIVGLLTVGDDVSYEFDSLYHLNNGDLLCLLILYLINLLNSISDSDPKLARIDENI